MTKENLHTKCIPFTYNDIALNEKPPIVKQNLCIFFFIIDGVECSLGGCGGPERRHFYQFLLWEGMVVLKELIFNSFYFGQVWWS